MIKINITYTRDVFKIVVISYILVFIIPTVAYCRCCNCCDCDDSVDKSLASAPITEEDKKITPLILKHLKLDNNQLNAIVEEVNKCSKDIDKLNKILEYTVDIDWNNPMCPNTLIKQKDNLCAYISYFHLMLNNPYFLKFFLICDKIERLHSSNTYVLNAMCELVCWCVERPSFNKKNMGSVDKIMKAFFKGKNSGKAYYHNTDNAVYLLGPKDRHQYGSFMPDTVIDSVVKTLCKDLGIGGVEDMKNPVRKKICDILCIRDNENAISSSKKQVLAKLLQQKNNTLTGIGKSNLENVIDTANVDEDNNYVREYPIKKVLGIRFHRTNVHYYSVVQNQQGIWYNKDTSSINNCGEMKPEEIQDLLDKCRDPNDNSLDNNLSCLVYVKDLQSQWKLQ